MSTTHPAADYGIVERLRGSHCINNDDLHIEAAATITRLTAERDALQALYDDAVVAYEESQAELAATKAVVDRLTRSRERLSGEMWKQVHNLSFGPAIPGNLCEAGRNELELRIESIQKVLDLDLVDFPEDDPNSGRAARRTTNDHRRINSQEIRDGE